MGISLKETVTYFDAPGKANTLPTLEIAKERALEAGIKTVILSSSGGFTAIKAMEVFKNEGVKFIVVGYRDRFPEELARNLKKAGHEMLYPGDHKFDHPQEAWELLRRFSEGMKVSIQIVLMATETGLVEEGEEVISLGGTGTIEFEAGGGVDTAIVMESVKGDGFFKIELPPGIKKKVGRKIKELLCKPR
jgi:hypothetical protein